MAVFLDTSGLIGVVDADDQWHAIAEKAWRELMVSRVPILTTSLVLIEMADGLSPLSTGEATELRERLIDSVRVEVVRTTADQEERAWGLFGQRSDKEWGMTDCVSFIVAQDRQIRDVFSPDHHFEQAGFRLLLKQ